MIFDHTCPEYISNVKKNNVGKYNTNNGAYWYSVEIVNNIIPKIDTDRNWVTLNVPGQCFDHSIVFIHNNLDMNLYSWLQDYEDLILVCGIPETCKRVKHLGHSIYLPLSVDVKYVEKYKIPQESKIDRCAYAGRYSKQFLDTCIELPEDIAVLCNMDRSLLLETMAYYKSIYAIGRTAIEAKILGCKVLPYDMRFPDPSIWKPWDNLDAAKYLQIELNKIDGIRL